jgi:hypothetical protein
MTTFLQDIIQALNNLGGQATLSQVYSEVERIRTSSMPRTWQASIRQAIESHSSDSDVFKGKNYFRKVGKGTWALRNPERISSTPQTKHISFGKNEKESLIPESFETISNILRTIKEYRDYSDPASPEWIEYICEFFHIIGFSTENRGSRLILLKDMGSTNRPNAIVTTISPGENFEEIVPGLKWETYIHLAAEHYRIDWGILTNGLQLRVFNFGDIKDQSHYSWSDLDGIIEKEELHNFFPIYKVFSFIKGGKKGFDQSRDHRHDVRVVTKATRASQKILPNNSAPAGSSQEQFIQLVLNQRFGDGFTKVGRYYMFESNSEIVYFQNSNVGGDEFWYRVMNKVRKILASSKKNAWLCLTNIPRKIAYIIPFKAIEQQIRVADYKEDNLEISIYGRELRWHQLGDWDIKKYRVDF